MAKKGAVITIAMKCTVCNSHNYITRRNKLNTPDKMEMKKFCKRCNKPTLHKESTKLD